MSRSVRRVAILLGLAAVLAPVGSASAANGAKRYSAQDKTWLQTSIQGDRFEITGGRLALRKSHSKAVRQLAARLVTDHTKSLGEAVAVAHKLKIKVPKSPSPSQQWELRVVGTFKGRTFNRWYSLLEVQDHKQDIMETSDENSEGTNPQIRKLAKDDLPVLRQHLTLARTALRASRK
jgi:putative membrane protein